jgi:hypothetical protein
MFSKKTNKKTKYSSNNIEHRSSTNKELICLKEEEKAKLVDNLKKVEGELICLKAEEQDIRESKQIKFYGVAFDNPYVLGDSNIESDLVFTVSGVTVKGHFYPIGAASPVLRNMLNNKRNGIVINVDEYESYCLLTWLNMLENQETSSKLAMMYKNTVVVLDQVFKMLTKYKDVNVTKAAQDIVNYYYSRVTHHNNSGDYSYPNNFNDVRNIFHKYKIEVKVKYSDW